MRRLFWPLSLSMLGAMVAAQVWSAGSETATWDEPAHVAAGCSYLRTGDLRMNSEHPPLAKLLCALPLCWLNPCLPLESPAWTGTDELEFGRVFLYEGKLIAMIMSFGLGFRHILPVYPFLYILLAAALIRLLPRGKAIPALVVLVCLQLAESAQAFPHDLAFFNWPSGGSGNGARYLFDSNFDWGQDLKGLRGHMQAHGLSKVCLCCFGGAVTGYYGIDEDPLPTTDDAAGPKAANCVATTSATPLHDLYVPPGSFRWLREKRPLDSIGHSNCPYDLRRTP